MYYITFGQNHTHPETGEYMKDYWVEIDSDSREDAYVEATRKYDNMWSMLYSEEDFDRTFFPKGNYDERDNGKTVSNLFEEKLKEKKICINKNDNNEINERSYL